jgi:hypothetical protein
VAEEEKRAKAAQVIRPPIIVRTMEGRYRTRTWLRGKLPAVLAFRIPKGRDCGAHQWYRQDKETWACYHCRATTDTEPFSPLELAENSLAALRTTLELLTYRPLDREELQTAARLSREAEQAIRQINRSLEEAAGSEDAGGGAADAIASARARGRPALP